jgi:hypothetical protein
MIALLALLSATARGEEPAVPVPSCPDAEVLVKQATQDVEAFYLAEAAAGLEQALVGFGCGPMASPELLSAWWQADGVMHLLQGNRARAVEALGAAARVAPFSFNRNYGEEADELFVLSPDLTAGKLEVRGVTRRDVLLIDGAPAPESLPAGLHFVQVGPLPGAARFAVEAKVEAGGTTLVVVPPPLPTAEVASGPTRAAPQPAVWIAGGGGLLMAASVPAWRAAAASKQDFLTTTDREAAAAVLRKNHTANLAAGGLLAGGAALVTVGVLRLEW